MPIDVAKMIADVPGAFHVKVADAQGALHAAVMTATTDARGANEYGYIGANTDTVYVPNQPNAFDAPRASLQIIYENSRTSNRIITEATNNQGLFWEISLGGELDESRV